MVKPQFTSLNKNAEHFSGGAKRQPWNRHATSAVQTCLYHSTQPGPVGDDRISAPRAALAVGLLPTYLADARAVEKYSPSTPDGALQLSVAENQMLEDLLVPSLTEFSSTLDFPADAIYYQPTQGRESFRKAMAAYLEDMLKLSKPMDEDGIVVGAGCNAVLENLCISLAEPGEGVMIPTPYYAAFEFDLVARAGLSISPVTTMEYQDFDRESNTIPHEAYYPNRASLDAAVERSLADGVNPRILLLSHPQNPLGICYPPEVVSEIIDWCREKKIHLVTDEIYAGSVYRDDANFVSALELASTGGDDALGLGPYIHLVYAFSKDFALSGLRVGALYSENPEIRLPLQKLNDLCCISSHTQLLMEKMLTTASDDPNVSWTKRFRAKSHERLRKRGNAWHRTLDELGIPYLKGTAGLFVWMDFQEFLPASGPDEERERELYLELLKEFGLLFTPGHSMKNERPGFFRCVFTAASDEEFDLGMERLRQYVHAKRS
ncbi:MAG: hypothetical protein SGBAC_008529 [Bacillariaceae sp.]